MSSSCQTGHPVFPRLCGAAIRAGLNALCVATVLAIGIVPDPALAVERTPNAFLAARKAVAAPAGARDICRRYSWACARSGRAVTITDKHMRLVRSVNSRINSRVREVTDKSQYRREEYWALPTRRGGDCEDFALLKKRELIRLGLPPERLLIATVLDRKRNAHAVLIVRTAQGDYVLDNLTSRILHWKRTGYSFIRMQNPSAPRSWNVVLKGGIFSKRS